MTEDVKQAIIFMIDNTDENIERILREHYTRAWAKKRKQEFTQYKRLLEEFLAK